MSDKLWNVEVMTQVIVKADSKEEAEQTARKSRSLMPDEEFDTRHKDIVCGMIAACVEHKVTAEMAKHWRCGRVAEVLTNGFDRFCIGREMGSRSLVDVSLFRSRGARPGGAS